MNRLLVAALLAGGPVTPELLTLAEERFGSAIDALMKLRGWMAVNEQVLAERVAVIAWREHIDGVRVLPPGRPVRSAIVQVGGA